MRGYLGNQSRGGQGGGQQGGGGQGGGGGRSNRQSRTSQRQSQRQHQRRPADARGLRRSAGGRRRSGDHCADGSGPQPQLDEPDGAEEATDQRSGQAGRDHGPREHGPLAQAGHHLRRPQGACPQGRRHLWRRRPGNPAGRLRFPALFGFQLPGGTGRHLRLPQPDPPLQSAHRRFDLRLDPAAEGRRALFRAAQGRRDQLRLPGKLARQGAVREPHAAASRPSG